MSAPGIRVAMSKLERIEDWAERMKRTDYKVGPLARICRVSERQLRRYVRRRFSLTPLEWIKQERMKQTRLSLERGCSVKAVATEAGFKWPEQLSRQFKGFYGEPPSHVRAGVHRAQG